MKKILLTIAILSGPFAFADDSEVVQIQRSHQEVPLTLELNAQTVRCLIGDYGASSLKISVADLKGYALFRQTTVGETEPCINAGRCTAELSPEKVIDATKPNENVNIKIALFEILNISHSHKTCSRGLREDISAVVRGLAFTHSDGGGIGDLPYDICVKMKESAKR